MLEIVLAIAGAFFFGFGALFQKKGLTRFPIAKISDKHILLKPFIAFRHLIFNRFWFLGGICSVSGWLVYFYALTLTEYLGIRPLTNLSLVIAVIGGSLWFKEHLCRRELLSISLILLGAIILSSQLSESKSLVTNDEVLVAALLILVLVFCINLGAGILTRRASITEITIPFAAGISYGIAEIFTNLLAIQLILESQNEGILQLIILNIVFFFSFVVLLNVVGFFLKQYALYRGRTTIIIPISTGLSLFISIVLAILVFGDPLLNTEVPSAFQFLRPLSIALIALGTIILGTIAQKDPSCTPSGTHNRS